MTPLAARSHPLRLSLTEEMHVRRFPSFTAPAVAVQLLVINPADENDGSYRHVASLCERLGIAPPPRSKHALASFDGFEMVWEQHSEFCTYSFIRPGPFNGIFDSSPLDHLPADWIETLPGEVYRATQIALLDSASPEPDAAELARHFRLDDLVCCDVYDAAARIWADFRQDPVDGFGRLLIRDQGLTGSDTPRLIQQLQELGNYRKMALLGMPVAQASGAELAGAEDRLARLSHAIASDDSDPEALLNELSALSATLARLQADTRYRMGATEAYAGLVADRLEGAKERRLSGYPSLKDFNERRLLPAIRTCRSFAERLEDVARRASWTTALLRTRVDTTMAQQSRDLLASMNRRTRLQLRLQQTVEGLSAVAITYYLIGLVHYVAKGFGHRPGLPDPEVIAAAAVPVMLLLVIFGLRRVHARLRDQG